MIVSFIKWDARNYCLAPLWKYCQSMYEKMSKYNSRQTTPRVKKLSTERSPIVIGMFNLTRLETQRKMEMIFTFKKNYKSDFWRYEKQAKALPINWAGELQQVGILNHQDLIVFIFPKPYLQIALRIHIRCQSLILFCASYNLATPIFLKNF